MTDHNENHPLNDEDLRAIELLVDGELGERQRRELLSSLDFTSDGWRQLALAFVAGQALEQDLGALVESTKASPATVETVNVTRGDDFWSRPTTILVTMAASFLIALGLGAYFRGAVTDQGPANVAATPADSSLPVLDEPDLRQPLRDAVPPPQVLADRLPAVRAPGAISLPVAADGVHNADLWTRPALPPHITELLEQLGHQVQSRRKLVPLELPDGRRVVVPVEDVEVEFVGDRKYQ